jgi:hypothetical protein
VIIVLVALSMMCIVSMGAFFYTAQLRVNEFAEAKRTEKINHAMCIAHVSHYVGNHFAADVLKAAAEAYDQPSTQTELQIIANQQYTPNGSRVPALWMVNRAEALIKEVEE